MAGAAARQSGIHSPCSSELGWRGPLGKVVRFAGAGRVELLGGEAGGKLTPALLACLAGGAPGTSSDVSQPGSLLMGPWGPG